MIRAEKLKITREPFFFDYIPIECGAWHESRDQVVRGIKFGKIKAILLRWVSIQMREILSENQQRAIKLHFIDGHTYEEISGIEKCSVSSAHRRVTAGINKMRAEKYDYVRRVVAQKLCANLSIF